MLIKGAVGNELRFLLETYWYAEFLVDYLEKTLKTELNQSKGI